MTLLGNEQMLLSKILSWTLNWILIELTLNILPKPKLTLAAPNWSWLWSKTRLSSVHKTKSELENFQRMFPDWTIEENCSQIRFKAFYCLLFNRLSFGHSDWDYGNVQFGFLLWFVLISLYTFAEFLPNYCRWIAMTSHCFVLDPTQFVMLHSTPTKSTKYSLTFCTILRHN